MSYKQHPRPRYLSSSSSVRIVVTLGILFQRVPTYHNSLIHVSPVVFTRELVCPIGSSVLRHIYVIFLQDLPSWSNKYLLLKKWCRYSKRKWNNYGSYSEGLLKFAKIFYVFLVTNGEKISAYKYYKLKVVGTEPLKPLGLFYHLQLPLVTYLFKTTDCLSRVDANTR